MIFYIMRVCYLRYCIKTQGKNKRPSPDLSTSVLTNRSQICNSVLHKELQRTNKKDLLWKIVNYF